MYYRPFDSSMGLWITNKFLKAILTNDKASKNMDVRYFIQQGIRKLPFSYIL